MKKRLLKFTFSILFFSFTQQAYALEEIQPLECPNRLQGFENIQIHQLISGDGTRCYLSIHPRDAFQTLNYRDFLFSHDGFFMVFNSYAGMLNAPQDGAREFYFLPSEFKGFDWKVEGEHLVITGFVGKTLKFSLKSAQLDFITGAQIQIADKVSPVNKGGMEIISTDFLYLDAGFKFGDSPSFDKSKNSDMVNTKRQTCRIKNTQSYRYTKDSAYLKSQQDLEKAVKAVCPNFDLK